MSVLLQEDTARKKRVCACGCGASMDGRRSDATWATKACALRWRRANPAKTAPGRGSAHVIDTRSRSGCQVSFTRAERDIVAAFAAVAISSGWDGTLTVAEAGNLALRALHGALPDRQKETLNQRRRAA